MKIKCVFLNELNANSRGYKVKVKVAEKNMAKVSPQKKVTYQTLLLEDDKGHKMRAALFGHQVEEFADIIAYNGDYEIANALIRPLNECWKGDPSLLEYQMSFGKYTIVQPIDGSCEHALPQYGELSLGPKVTQCTEQSDVEEDTTQQETHVPVDLVGNDSPKSASVPAEGTSSSKRKQVTTKGSAPFAKRCHILQVKSVCFEDVVPETALVDDMLDALTTYSDAYAPNGSPSPSPSPRSPIDV